MLARNRYSAGYIRTSRESVDAQIASYRIMAASIPPDGRDYLDAFEPAFFTNLLLALDAFFTHRTRALEGKDGNPLNEVRVLCRSITENGRRMTADSTIRLDPARSVLGLRVGDPIAIREADFVRLANAYFAEIEARFGES